LQGSRLFADWCVIAALATLIVLGTSLTGITRRADNLIYDRLIAARAPPPSDQIMLIAIDNRSLQALGKWPWPRRFHAALLAQLGKAQPRAIGYDVLFPEATADDAALATAIRAAGPVYLPLLLDTASSENADFSEVEPVRPVHDAAAGIGHVNVHFDSDGLVRRADLAFHTQHQTWPHLMLLLAGRKAGDATELPILFQSQAQAFRTASFVDVMRGEVPPIFFRDKFVIVGATGDGMGDQFPAPVRGGGLMSGIDLQANMLNTILSGRRVADVPLWSGALAALCPVWVLLLALWRWRPMALLWLSLGLLLTVLFGTAALFAAAGWWLAPSPALLALIFVYPVWGWRRLAALSTSIEVEMAAVNVDTPVAGRRSARADRVAQQVTMLQGAMQQSREVRQGAHDREAALQMLSHDMRAPQASIITLLEAEGATLAPALRARLAGYARRTLALADNFVQLARLNETVFAPEAINLCDVLLEAMDELYPLSAVRNVRVVGEGLDDPHDVLAEPGLLFRALVNLLDNAVKYSPQGGKVTCIVRADGEQVQLTISDQGAGMTEAQVAALFAKFGTVGAGRHAGSSGAGLGLALVKAALDRHNSTITCFSTPGAGTTFTLRFPACAAL
jgi:CHASE2 domain-containing sensor protein/nitrogen-specific signal transduction histidine kinase